MEQKIIYLLIGNSRWHFVKIKNKKRQFFDATYNSKFKSEISDNTIWASVGNIPRDILLNPKKELKTSNIPLIKFPENIGVDRALASYATISLFDLKNENKNFLIVDAGTVLSLTLISNEGEFLGGQLIPGIKSQFEIMKINTQNLKNTQLGKLPNELFPKQTNQAMHKGIIQSLIGSIFLASSSKNNIIVLTGGDSQIIHDELSKLNINTILKKNLILEAMINFSLT